MGAGFGLGVCPETSYSEYEYLAVSIILSGLTCSSKTGRASRASSSVVRRSRSTKACLLGVSIGLAFLLGVGHRIEIDYQLSCNLLSI